MQKDKSHINNRRSFLRRAGLGLSAPLFFSFTSEMEKRSVPVDKNVFVTGIDLHVIKVNDRGDWYFIEIKTNKKEITGVGECSHAFNKNYINGREDVVNEIKYFFNLIKDKSPFQIEQFRQSAFVLADNKLKRTVVSGIEQALWDVCGKTLGVPSYHLWGGRVRETLRVYANINRATNDKGKDGKRLVESFQKTAEAAVNNGFKAIKLAPFDEMRPLDISTQKEVEVDIEHAIKCLEGVRRVVGKDVDVLVDVHSHLDVALSISTAKRLESINLYWYEEPVNPEKYPDETKVIKDNIQQVLAGGESIFGREGYEKIITDRSYATIMPDVKHCGGLLELKYIAAQAEVAGIKVAPHNPSGPIATAASIAICASLPNFDILEIAFGEVPWYKDLIFPVENIKNGFISVSDKSGLGISLNHQHIKKHV